MPDIESSLICLFYFFLVLISVSNHGAHPRAGETCRAWRILVELFLDSTCSNSDRVSNMLPFNN